MEFGLSQNERVVRMLLPGLRCRGCPRLLPGRQVLLESRASTSRSDEFASPRSTPPTAASTRQDRLRVPLSADAAVAPGPVEFKKDADLTERDTESSSKVWNRLAADEPERDPADVLEELGARVYRENAEWTWERLGGYVETKRVVETTVVSPFLHATCSARSRGWRRQAGLETFRARAVQRPPGCGKTTMARVLANVSKRRLCTCPSSPVMSMYYGESERASPRSSRKRPLRALQSLPRRDRRAGRLTRQLMHEATRRVLSVLLRNLQGIARASTSVIGANERAVDLDGALNEPVQPGGASRPADVPRGSRSSATFEASSRRAPRRARREQHRRAVRARHRNSAAGGRRWAHQLIAQARRRGAAFDQYVEALASKAPVTQNRSRSLR